MQSACQLADAECEPHPLWEYPCRALTAAHTLATFDFSGGEPADLQTTEFLDVTA